MNILACDVGLKRIGLAVYKAGVILPITPIIRQNRNQAARELDSILNERKITHLVVGLPSGGEAQHKEMHTRIKHFIDLLTFSGAIHFINEDNSSKEALESFTYMGRQKRQAAQKDGRIDSMSAYIILQRYIESIKDSK